MFTTAVDGSTRFQRYAAPRASIQAKRVKGVADIWSREGKSLPKARRSAFHSTHAFGSKIGARAPSFENQPEKENKTKGGHGSVVHTALPW